MAAGFEYFDSTQPGAPVLTGQAGKMVALLDWVLVSKGGWEVAYSGTNIRAYRSLTGNRFYLRVDDTQALYSRLRAYRNMTAISTGTGQFPGNAQTTNINLWGVRKGMDNNATAHRYWGIRTNRWLVLFVECTKFEVTGMMYRGFTAFGDFPSLCEADSHNCVLVGANDISTNYFITLTNLTEVALSPNTYVSTTLSAAVSGTPNGGVISPISALHAPYKNSTADMRANLAIPQRLNFGPMVLGGLGTLTQSSGVYPRGRFPNVSMVYGPAGEAPDPLMPAVDLVPITVGSRQFLPILPSANGYQAGSGSNSIGDCYLLEMTDTDGAL